MCAKKQDGNTKKNQNVRQPPSSCGKATERVFWIGRRPFNLTIMKVKVVVGIGLLKVKVV